MRFSRTKEGEVLVIALRGRMSLGEGDAEAGQEIRSALAAGEKKILLDMKGVPVLDSSGVGELMAAYTSVSRHGGTIKLLGLSPRVGEVLKITRLVGIFDIYDDRIEAIESFS
ncbi:MAG TPA: STAS domain-containing protein [Thermoanaerobaculia bacterium]|jgi:anti-sigma B factor antagonist|nr:STAS domain-containing protein [Thermoanaerobaculia bacterium]